MLIATPQPISNFSFANPGWRLSCFCVFVGLKKYKERKTMKKKLNYSSTKFQLKMKFAWEVDKEHFKLIVSLTLFLAFCSSICLVSSFSVL